MSPPFVDTNVLVYLFRGDDSRRAVAEAVLADGATVSVQVLNELTNVLRKKAGLDWEKIGSVIDDLCILTGTPRALTAATHLRARTLAARYTLSFYDALIVAAAAEAGCNLLYSEDMHHGLVIDGVYIANPFRIAAAAP